MVSFIQKALELRISNQWFILYTVTRTKDINTMVSSIQW
jgi:hypothetical protein